MIFPRRCALFVLPAFVMLGCGQKGPLYLADAQSPPVTAKVSMKKHVPKAKEAGTSKEVTEKNAAEEQY